MSTTEKIFVMPNADALANALVGVAGFGSLVRHLYPAVIKRADTMVTPPGFVAMFRVAIYDYALAADAGDHAVERLLDNLHNYARAIITDPGFLDETLDAIKAAGLADGR